MKIIIVGAGRIGMNLSKILSEENNEIYLIERSEQIAGKIAEKIDAKVIVGGGADPDTLNKAQVKDADLVLAVTTSDETNLVVCSLAGSLGAKRRIARVRNTSLSRILHKFGYHQFKIDEIINPELVTSQSIIKMIQTPGSSEVADFAGGRMLLRGFDIQEASSLCRLKLGDLRDEDFPWPFLIISVIRDDKVLIPTGETMVHKGDHIYVLLPAQSLGEFLTFVDPAIKMPKKIVIFGATITGRHVVKSLTSKIKDIILLEEDTELAKDIADELESVTVINGSASEADILTECGIEAADVFIAASDNDHSNLISSVLAKKMGAKTTIITTQQTDYMIIANALNIDAIVNPHYLAVERILHLARGKEVSSVTKLSECEAEAVEFIAQEGSAVTKNIIKNIKFPPGTIIGAVYQDDGVELANGDTQIESGQKVISFCQENARKKLQTLFVAK